MTSPTRNDNYEEVVVLTGASRGIGAALAAQLLSPSRRLICVARSTNAALVQQARTMGVRLDYLQQDLADMEGTDALAASIFADLTPPAGIGSNSPAQNLRRIVLINNAGVVDPIGPASQLDFPRAVAAVHINLLAAMSFTARLLAATEHSTIERRILNVSSGAGRRPIEGWSVYATAKAALDMFTRCVKLEQDGKSNPARVCALAPGVVDTAMQETIRGTEQERLPGVGRFRHLKESGQLASPEETARRILSLLASEDFGGREIDDIRNY
jgi:NAD(P)-dependent dehydrogenase (short-subunit alcohol dehydrogenase family)